MGVTARHFRRLRRTSGAEGDAVVLGRAVWSAFEPGAAGGGLGAGRWRRPEIHWCRDFGPTLLAEHLEPSFGVRVSPDTLRGWMLAAGLWRRRRRRLRHRRRRPRRVALGELGQWDGSAHRWLEGRVGAGASADLDPRRRDQPADGGAVRGARPRCG